MGDTLGLYLHLPFCRRVCFYCHFVKYPYQEEKVSEYLSLLLNETSLRAQSLEDKRIDTIYFGGGSPSLLHSHQFGQILDRLSRDFSLSDKPEISLEMNPEDCEPEKLAALKGMGFTRLSIGVQSFADKDLAFLKRNHNASGSIESIENVLAAGFSNINLDFIIGLPSQTRESLKNNIKKVKKFSIPHVSVYLLEGVKNSSVNEELEHDQYYYLKHLLEAAGFLHYEISNYSRKNDRCLHNLKYWQDKEYIGLGISASGYLAQRDYKNVTTLEQYRELLGRGQLPAREKNRYPRKVRRIITGLRLIRGIPERLLDGYPEARKLLMSQNYLKAAAGRVFIPPDKLLLLNEILGYFI